MSATLLFSAQTVGVVAGVSEGHGEEESPTLDVLQSCMMLAT